ncbi:MAG: D-cysteine desulfhydrase family protein [Desulfurococcaceae archaeon]
MLGKVLSFPRYKLITLPTPMEKAPALSKELGMELWIKRDDAVELAMGGNKARKLEFILGHIVPQGYDSIITAGAYISNCVRLAIAAANKAGLESYVVVYKHLPDLPLIMQGNMLLNKILGGNIIIAEKREQLDTLMMKTFEELKAKGKRPYIIPIGAATEHGTLGYVLAALEILQQSLDRGFKPKYVVHSTGSVATQVGLILGFKILGMDDVKVIGIASGGAAKALKERGLALAKSTNELLGANINVTPDDFTIYDQYSFGGYGVITKEVVEVIARVAKKEGILLDPVYTAKAMYGLMDLAQKGEIKGPAIFVHTGGGPILFQHADDLLKFM